MRGASRPILAFVLTQTRAAFYWFTAIFLNYAKHCSVYSTCTMKSQVWGFGICAPCLSPNDRSSASIALQAFMLSLSSFRFAACVSAGIEVSCECSIFVKAKADDAVAMLSVRPRFLPAAASDFAPPAASTANSGSIII